MPTNFERAQSIDGALRDFADEMGLDIKPGADGPHTVAGDFIANVLHWVAEQPENREAGAISAIGAAHSGINHFLSEHHSDEPHDLGPEAEITIIAACAGFDYSIARKTDA
jgi:hypothetical protein